MVFEEKTCQILLSGKPHMLQILCSSVRVKKSLAHPHVDVMLKFRKKLTKQVFFTFAPLKKLKLICGGHFEFQ